MAATADRESKHILLAVLGLWLGASACDGATAPIDGGGADSASAPDVTGGGGYCPVVGYAPCGGDLLGTWAFRDLCPDDPVAAAALCQHPYDSRAECVGVGNEARCDGNQTGTLTFRVDGSVDISTQAALVGTWNFSDVCLAAVEPTGATPAERCANLGSARLSCAYNAGCTCVGEPSVQTDMNVAAYAVAGNEVTIGTDPLASYCIVGDILTMDYYVFHPVSWRYWVLQRQ